MLDDEVEIVGIKEETKKQLLLVLKCSVNNLDKAQAGDNVGVLLRGVAT